MRQISDMKVYLTKSNEGKDVLYCSISFVGEAHSFFHTSVVDGDGVLTSKNAASEMVKIQAWVYELTQTEKHRLGGSP